MSALPAKRFTEVMEEGEFFQKKDMVGKLSKDYYWYSPVLAEELKEKSADFVIRPKSIASLKAGLTAAVKEKLPVTIRGAGTGNYGQAVPLHGGLLVDMSELNRMMEVGEGFVRVQAGMKIRELERKLVPTNQELTIYPSTFAKATMGGFIAGGSGGIGSITWGNLWDGNVLEATVLTMEEEVRELNVTGEELKNYIHSYGVNGILVDVTIPVKPKTSWSQYILNFSDFFQAMSFARELSESPGKKRLVTVFEREIGDFFLPLRNELKDCGDLVFIEIAEESEKDMLELAQQYGGIFIYQKEAELYRKGMGISDFTWNHTTLWAMKTDPAWTYLQNFFSLENVESQIKTVKEKYGGEVLLHFEWIMDKGRLVPAALPLIKFTSKKRLYEIITFLNDIGAGTNDPHTYLLGAGGWDLQLQAIVEKKKENDPHGLLNQGKIPNFETV
ncbi:FAD-binding oxidoreductase [Salibacterium aidingense]|uniref:FAD-binding oxidoreductase n=1 Tax=Salibacterium aidingense TaxID=384933 RepID=UPI00041467EA|nr:FAD-binding oxidoreductase [Salibacterium aidingense]